MSITNQSLSIIIFVSYRATQPDNAVEMEAQSQNANLSNSAVISMTEAPIACGYKFRKAA